MSLKTSGIYYIEHLASGRRYVGSAVNLERRFKKHLTQLRSGKHHSYKLQEAWNEFGEGAFEFNVLIRCSEDKLIELEQRTIDRLNVVRVGFNVAEFADSPNKGRKMSAESRAKISASSKNRKPISEETRQRLREAAVERERMKKETGFQVSDETKAKLAAAGKGREVSAETREKIRAANAGRPLTEEHCQKLSKAQRAREKRSEAEIAGRKAAAEKNTGRKRSESFGEQMSELASNRSPEHRAKLSAALTGKKLTEEHKMNMKKARRAAFDASVIHELLGV